MSGHSDDRKLGKRDGLRYTITWLHNRAESMNVPRAKAILNSAAFDLGNEIREGHLPPITDAPAPERAADPTPAARTLSHVIRNMCIDGKGNADIARTLDDFTKVAVERERERCSAKIERLRAIIAAPQAGNVLRTIIELLPLRPEWTVANLKAQVAASNIGASSKEIHNAIGYLVRRKQIKRLSYGRYKTRSVREQP